MRSRGSAFLRCPCSHLQSPWGKHDAGVPAAAARNAGALQAGRDATATAARGIGKVAVCEAPTCHGCMMQQYQLVCIGQASVSGRRMLKWTANHLRARKNDAVFRPETQRASRPFRPGTCSGSYRLQARQCLYFGCNTRPGCQDSLLLERHGRREGER